MRSFVFYLILASFNLSFNSLFGT